MEITQIGAGGQQSSPRAVVQQSPAAPAVVAPQGATQAELPGKAVESVSKAEESGRLKKAVDDVNKVVQSLSNELEFSVDKDSGMKVVKVLNTQTKEVIRQIPSEEVLAIAKALDTLHGLIIRQEA